MSEEMASKKDSDCITKISKEEYRNEMKRASRDLHFIRDSEEVMRDFEHVDSEVLPSRSDTCQLSPLSE